MAGYFERRKSRAAIWCLRFAVFCVPFLLLTIFLHRSESITTHQTFWLISAALAMLLASLIFGLRAAVDLWEKGYKGGRATVNGIALSLMLIIPFGIQLVRALENPQLNDVSTDVISPPAYLTPINGLDDSKNAEDNYSDYNSRLIVTNYPKLIARRYSAPPERVFQGTQKLLKRWGWQIITAHNIPKLNTDIDEESDEELLAGGEEELVAQSGGNIEDGALPDVLIQIRAKSFVLKLPSELMIRLVAENEATLVDMRSSSNWGPHDFGGNADNIEVFLQALDDELAGIAGE